MDNLTTNEKQIIRRVWNQTLKLLGMVLICLFGMIFGCIVYSFAFDTLFFYHCLYQNIYLTIILMLPGLYFAFNVIFNYALAIIISPGSTQDMFIAIDRVQAPDMQAPFTYDPSRCQFNQSQLTVQLNQNTLSYCQKCQLPKPYRAHHCSICGKCVLKMDHHCPWINQCVGHNNHRYFLLFLIHILFGTLYISLLNSRIVFTDEFNEFYYMKTKLFNTIWPLDMSLVLMIGAFSGWNWYLAISGFTTIEFLEKAMRNKPNFSGSVIENMRAIFGDVHNWLQITAPSVRDLLSNGVIWPNPTQPQDDLEEGIELVDEEAIQI